MQGIPSAKSSKEVPPFSLAVKISAVAIALVASFLLAELLLRLMPRFDVSNLTLMQLRAAGPYSNEELRTDLPHFTEPQGADCITIQTGLHYYHSDRTTLGPTLWFCQ
jgi:hypothetical protein